MKKCILLIDMDGVTCDWVRRIVSMFEAKYPDRKMLPYEELTQFYIETMHPPEWSEDIREVMNGKGFYHSLEPIPGAIESLKDIEENCLDFIDPFICSSPSVATGRNYSHSDKVRWVNDHLGSFWAHRLILTKDKTLVRGHILIDDKPKIEGAMTPTWQHLVYAQPWNEEHQVRFTWDGWSNFRDTVLAPSFGAKKEPEREKSGIILLS